MAADLATLDRQINELNECKPLTETEVEALCEKVCVPGLASTLLVWRARPRGGRRAVAPHRTQAREVLMEESNVQQIAAPVII